MRADDRAAAAAGRAVAPSRRSSQVLAVGLHGRRSTRRWSTVTGAGRRADGRGDRRCRAVDGVRRRVGARGRRRSALRRRAAARVVGRTTRSTTDDDLDERRADHSPDERARGGVRPSARAQPASAARLARRSALAARPGSGCVVGAVEASASPFSGRRRRRDEVRRGRTAGDRPAARRRAPRSAAHVAAVLGGDVSPAADLRRRCRSSRSRSWQRRAPTPSRRRDVHDEPARRGRRRRRPHEDPEQQAPSADGDLDDRQAERQADDDQGLRAAAGTARDGAPVGGGAGRAASAARAIEDSRRASRASRAAVASRRTAPRQPSHHIHASTRSGPRDPVGPELESPDESAVSA